LVATASVWLWDVKTGKQTGSLRGAAGKQVKSLAFNPQGKTLAAASEDGFVRLWDYENEKVTKTVKLGGKEVPLDELAFSPEGRHLAVLGAADEVVYLLRLEGPPRP
jgi:WD40 repeat protein